MYDAQQTHLDVTKPRWVRRRLSKRIALDLRSALLLGGHLAGAHFNLLPNHQFCGVEWVCFGVQYLLRLWVLKLRAKGKMRFCKCWSTALSAVKTDRTSARSAALSIWQSDQGFAAKTEKQSGYGSQAPLFSVKASECVCT